MSSKVKGAVRSTVIGTAAEIVGTVASGGNEAVGFGCGQAAEAFDRNFEFRAQDNGMYTMRQKLTDPTGVRILASHVHPRR